MKTIIVSISTSICLLLSSCASFNSGGVRPLINAAVLVATTQHLKKNPDQIEKFLDLAVLLETAADVSDNTLTKENFVEIVNKVSKDSEWAMLGAYLYNIYANNVTMPEKYSKHAPTLRQLATALRDAVLVVSPSK